MRDRGPAGALNGSERPRVSLFTIPDDRVLDALRGALEGVLGAEAQSPLAKHHAALADMVLSRWIAAATRLPEIDARLVAVREYEQQRAAAALAQLDPARHGPAATIALPELIRRLAAVLPEVSEGQATEIRGIIADAVAIDAKARAEFEAAVAAVTAAVPEAERARSPAPDIERLQRYLNARFADAGPVTVRSINPLPGGHSKETILFEIAPHPMLPASMVIRMDAGRYGTSVRDEFPLLEALHREGIAVPVPLWLEPREDVFGGAFLVTRRMPGAPPGTLWEVGAASAALGAELAAALGRLHSTPLRRLASTRHDSSRPLVEAMLADSERRWRDRMPMPSVAMEAAFGWMRERARHFDVPASLVHGDPGLQNVIVDHGRLQCLLDWEFAHPGDPAEDLAYCRPAIERIMPWPEFLAHHRAAGGPEITDERLAFFEIWRCLRNAALAAGVLFDLQHGAVRGLEMAAVGVNTYPRLEAQLAASLARVIRA